MTVSRRTLIQSAALASAGLAVGSRAWAASDAPQIDRNATSALNQLYREDPGTIKLRNRAAGILVFPRVVKAGFIFGGQGGKGVLRVHGESKAYYSIIAASFGLQAGVQYFSYAIFFLDPTALTYLDQSDGWAIGTDPNVVVIDRSAAASINSTTLAKRVVAVPFNAKGLMAGLTLEGSKITTYNPNS